MKFALIGDHPDGLDFARALAAAKRHELIAYSGPALGAEVLNRDGLTPRRVADVEEIFADPQIVGVIVAASKASRGAILRRAVQSERHVLCVHPADEKPDLAIETSMIQADTGFVVLPLMPDAFHPGVARFAQLCRPTTGTVLELRRDSRDDFWLEAQGDDPTPGLPGWDVLRRIGGEIIEVFALGVDDHPTPGQPLLVSGKLASGGLFHASFQAEQLENYLRIARVASRPLALVFPEGCPGPATLTYEDEHGALRTETWPALPPWAPMLDAFEKALFARGHKRSALPGETDNHCWTSSPASGLPTSAIQAAETMVSDTVVREAGPTLGWTDAIRALELDDSVRRSLHYRRAYSLDLQDVTEDSTFKGTMTLVGCSLMWIILVMLFLSIWLPWIGWLILPVIVAFLALQLLRGVVRTGEKDSQSK